MRIGITIVFNGLHHLKHNEWADKLTSMLDYWAIVDGLAANTGSTSWCNQLFAVPSVGRLLEGSLDGTNEYLDMAIAKYPGSVGAVALTGARHNKDSMMNVGVDMVHQEFGPTLGKAPPAPSGPHFLWQLDVDEQWTPEQMDAAEQELLASGGTCGCFHADHYVGEHLLARGTWGEGNDPVDPLRNAYRRLWLWDGRKFATHEPPVLEGGNGKEVLLLQKPDQPASLGSRFAHYAYFYEKDVEFKEQFYSGHEGLLSRWKALQARPKEDFPRPLSDLITGPWGKTKTEVVWL